MKSTKRATLASTLGLGALIGATMVGCDSSTNAPGTNDDSLTQVEDLNDPYGGYNRSAEPAGFGDPFLLSDQGEVTYVDPMADEPGILDLMGGAENDLYAVRLTWGFLARDEAFGGGDPVDWSGGATVGEGAVLAVRTIHFEQAQNDHIVRPREDRKVLEWVSTTSGGLDGVQLLVLDPPTVADGGRAEGNTLSIEMPLVSESFEVALMDGLDMTLAVDGDGHQFRIQARKVELLAECRRGWMSGRWHSRANTDDLGDDLAEGRRGEFRGHWVNARGEIGGSMKGFYGVNARGHRVLFGKLIDSNGNFRGLVRGTWNTAESLGVGSFRAHWLDADHNVVGGMRGVWERRDRNGAGLFHGAWATNCDSSEDEVEIDESIF